MLWIRGLSFLFIHWVVKLTLGYSIFQIYRLIYWMIQWICAVFEIIFLIRLLFQYNAGVRYVFFSGL